MLMYEIRFRMPRRTGHTSEIFAIEIIYFYMVGTPTEYLVHRQSIGQESGSDLELPSEAFVIEGDFEKKRQRVQRSTENSTTKQ